MLKDYVALNSNGINDEGLTGDQVTETLGSLQPGKTMVNYLYKVIKALSSTGATALSEEGVETLEATLRENVFNQDYAAPTVNYKLAVSISREMRLLGDNPSFFARVRSTWKLLGVYRDLMKTQQVGVKQMDSVRRLFVHQASIIS